LDGVMNVPVVTLYQVQIYPSQGQQYQTVSVALAQATPASAPLSYRHGFDECVRAADALLSLDEALAIGGRRPYKS
jgi:hypothetical protein